MSITDELREWWVHRFPVMDGNLHNDFTAIANRIDIAHKHAIGYVDDRDPETMAENGWVRLPKDADGEYIHIGDRMENNERVVRIVLTDDSWEPSVYVEKQPNVLHEYFCHEVSHCQPDTWERIIEDTRVCLLSDYKTEVTPTMRWKSDIESLVERCRRLAGAE